ncbi:hypothetical protein E2C01_074683 [Portunus trituberculatus]|uniref:Uncharacterized protein n=1 Tax=Portunus trituberculatus TaxID=210409 RepID=A0A5B7IDS8_PORTR|nr:hypothetical protein [Portunus trituberculatus]
MSTKNNYIIIIIIIITTHSICNSTTTNYTQRTIQTDKYQTVNTRPLTSLHPPHLTSQHPIILGVFGLKVYQKYSRTGRDSDDDDKREGGLRLAGPDCCMYVGLQRVTERASLHCLDF